MKEDWQLQMQNIVNTVEKLENYVVLSDSERKAIAKAAERRAFVGATPYYASLMDKSNPNCPIRLQFIPREDLTGKEYEMPDYLMWKENRDAGELGESRFSHDDRPESIARQYRHKIAFTYLPNCSIYCTFCFREELTQDRTKPELKISSPRTNGGFDWLEKHIEIRDVLITGGDPLTLSDKKISDMLERLRAISHVKLIRFGSRVPVALPHRITEGLTEVFRTHLKHRPRVPIWINTHFNHPKEITERSIEGIYRLLDSGVSVGNQTVLLRDINDREEIFWELHQKLAEIGVRANYVFQCEPAPGAGRFMVPIKRGQELMRSLWPETSSMARPNYALATRIGKINLMDQASFAMEDENTYTLQNRYGERVTIPKVIIPKTKEKSLTKSALLSAVS